MYLRPGNLFREFRIEPAATGAVTPRGRVKSGYVPDGGRTLKAVLAQATPEEKERYRQLRHPITHILTQRGAPKAKPGDRILLDARVFYIQGVDEPASLGLWTLYYAQERYDTHDDGYREEDH